MFRKVNPIICVALGLSLFLAACSSSETEPSAVVSTPQSPPSLEPNAPQSETGTAVVTDISYEGYTLFAPLQSTMTYLIDKGGNMVHSWETGGTPGQAVYLLEDGNLLHTSRLRSSVFDAGGIGGRVEEYTWEGDLVWSFEYAGDTYHLHHDVEMLPNSNVLMIAWELKSTEEALAAGRSPNTLPEDGSLWPDHIIEVNPSTNQIVWEWHVWDHLVQDYDSSKANYGVVSEHPELIDLNYSNGRAVSDWNHINSIDYNPALDQILLSVHSFSEIWVIDHSVSTTEAAGQAGDLLYRWGNPQAYQAGTSQDQQLFSQHDAQWIEAGLPGAGNILILNNGDRRLRPYSSVVEIAPPVDEAGNYALATGAAYAPDSPIWEYAAANPEDFFADHISGAQRLSNGNTLICDGTGGRFFEVASAGELVWEYVIPTASDGGGPSVSVFRAIRYSADYAGLVGKDLSSLGAVPEQSGSALGGQQPGGNGRGQPPGDGGGGQPPGSSP